MRRSRVPALLLALVPAIAAGTLPSAPAGASLRQVAVGNFYFEDESVGDGRIEVQVGDQLRFSVLDGGPGTPHTVEVDDLGIHSGSLASGETFTTPVLDTPGTYVLYCKPHLNRGHKTSLVVSGLSAPPTTAPSPVTTAPAPAPGGGTAATTTTTVAAPPQTTAPQTTASRATTTTAAGGAPPPATTATTAAPKATATTTAARSGSGAAPAGTVPAPGAAPATGPAPPATGQAQLEEASDGPVPSGVGRIDGGQESAAPGLSDILSKLPGSRRPWTHGVRLGFLALLPMALAAGLALLRRRSLPPHHS